MIGPGFAAAALAPSVLKLVVACVAIGVVLTLAVGWGIPWVWNHVSIVVK